MGRHRHDTSSTQYIRDYRQVSGIMVPHRRRVYLRGIDNQLVPEPVLLSIDIAHIGFQSSEHDVFKLISAAMLQRYAPVLTKSFSGALHKPTLRAVEAAQSPA